MSDLPITQMIYQPVWKQAPESFLANALFQLTSFIYSPYALEEIKLKSEVHEPNAFWFEFSWLVKLCIAAALLGPIPIYIMWLKCKAKPKTSAYIELDVIPKRPPETPVENPATEVSLATVDQLDELRFQGEEQETNLPSTSGMQQQQKPVAIARKKISIERETQTQYGSKRRQLNSMQRQQRTAQTQTQSQPLAQFQAQSQVQTPVVTLRKTKKNSYPVWHS